MRCKASRFPASGTNVLITDALPGPLAHTAIMSLDFRFKIDDTTNVRICFEERGLHPRGPCSFFIEYCDLRKGGRGLRFNLRGRGKERGNGRVTRGQKIRSAASWPRPRRVRRRIQLPILSPACLRFRGTPAIRCRIRSGVGRVAGRITELPVHVRRSLSSGGRSRLARHITSAASSSRMQGAIA